MFSFLNPFLLWGLAAIAAPIVIHLLLRQKPRSRPWAAMRWLQNALLAAQRKYKLTNLLLLIMRCLIIALLALAVARPHLGHWSEGGDLVILLDVSASMANDAKGKGPLQDACDKLREMGFSQSRVCVITIGHESHILSDGSPAEALRSLQQLESDYLPGGLNRALDKETLALVTSTLRPDSTLLCVSDFRQDDGSALIKTLNQSVHQIACWQVGEQRDNAFIHSINPLPDFVAGQATQFQVVLHGSTSKIAQVQVNDGSASPITVQDPLQVSLPPLPAGKHKISLSFEDDGLVFDNNLQISIHVRAAIPSLIVQKQFGYLAAVIDAAHQQLDYRNVDPARLHTEPLPEKGIIVLDSQIGNADRIIEWINNGGVCLMWSDALEQHPTLNEICSAIKAPTDLTNSGRITIEDNSSLRSLSRIELENMACLQLGPEAETLLQLGEQSLAARQAIGDGYAIVISKDLRGNDLFWTQGAAPYWLRGILRDSSALAQQPRILHAGFIINEDLTLLDQTGKEHAFIIGDSLALQPGLFSEKESQRPVVVLPNQAESSLALPRHDGMARSIKQAMPDQLGSDWSLWILVILACLCIGEGLFAAHAGRHYGHA